MTVINYLGDILEEPLGRLATSLEQRAFGREKSKPVGSASIFSPATVVVPRSGAYKQKREQSLFIFAPGYFNFSRRRLLIFSFWQDNKSWPECSHSDGDLSGTEWYN